MTHGTRPLFCRSCPVLFCLCALTFLSALSPAFARESSEILAITEDSRPWVYWFWKNGNINREGITADLEAMQRVGIGGMIVMEVSLSVPPGPVKFFSDEWRDLFAFAVSEADRLGLKVCVNSAPGWTGSGGPWISPELSMKKVVASETTVQGPAPADTVLKRPEALLDFYRDIAVLAFPTPKPGAKIEEIAEKALYQRGPFSSAPGIRPHFTATARYAGVDPDQTIPLTAVRDISESMDADGRLVWDVPEGSWTVMRLGFTTTGQTNRPAPLPGLECDKLDPAALESHFNAYIRKLVEDAGEHAGVSLTATHFDSWEVGGQNWTNNFRREFEERRGYDLLPYLPVMMAYVVDSRETSERFLWDLRQTVSEMIARYHGGRMRDLAHECGLTLSIEPYDMTPCDDMTLGATADVPMCEFWSNHFDTRYSVREAVSIAHVYGRPVIGAEAFTSVDKWLTHPGSVKTLGDWAFSEGVNKMVIHRYIHQPFAQARPGLSLGPHGLHYERTNTWWEYTRGWHEYLARCQAALRNAPVADLLYLSPEGAPNVFQGPEPGPAGYKYDACTPEALLTLIRCNDGFLTGAGGARYAALVLPDWETMTPALLERVNALVEEGATLVGPPPLKSPSLSGYPQCDQRIRDLAVSLWPGERRPAQRIENKVGKGRVFWGGPLNTNLPDAQSASPLDGAQWIWSAGEPPALAAPPCRRYFRRVFALNEVPAITEAHLCITADNSFKVRVNGKAAGRGDNFTQAYVLDLNTLLTPGDNLIAVEVENGDVSPNPAGLIAALRLKRADGSTESLYTDGQWQSAGAPQEGWDTDTDACANWPAAAVVGPAGMAPWGMPQQTRPRADIYPPSHAVETLMAALNVAPDFASKAPLRFNHQNTPQGDLYFISNGENTPVTEECIFRVNKGRPVLLHPEDGSVRPLFRFALTADNRTAMPLRFEPGESYFILFTASDPRTDTLPKAANFPEKQLVLEVKGPWQVQFDVAAGGPPEPIAFEQLQDWAGHDDPRIRYYSGTASYTCDIEVPDGIANGNTALYLDLGRVEVTAKVRLNGNDAGIAWKTPYRVNISSLLRPGKNRLEVQAANLWINRMIGDETLPPDSDRNENGTLKAWPAWLLEGKQSPTGRVSFATWRHWTADDPLQPSGLLGPVTVYSE